MSSRFFCLSCEFKIVGENPIDDLSVVLVDEVDSDRVFTQILVEVGLNPCYRYIIIKLLSYGKIYNKPICSMYKLIFAGNNVNGTYWSYLHQYNFYKNNNI